MVMSAIRFLMILLERRADWDLDFAGVGQDQRQREAIDVAAHEIRPWQTGQPAFTALAFWSRLASASRRRDQLPAIARTFAGIITTRDERAAVHRDNVQRIVILNRIESAAHEGRSSIPTSNSERHPVPVRRFL